MDKRSGENNEIKNVSRLTRPLSRETRPALVLLFYLLNDLLIFGCVAV